MRSRVLGFSLLFCALAAAGCSTTIATNGSPNGTNGGPNGNTDGGATGEGGTINGSPTDDDDDEGPAWDGTLSGAPRGVAEGVYSMTVTGDGDVVYSTETAVLAKPVAGGSSTSVKTSRYRHVLAAGRAAIVTADERDSTTTCGAWSRAGGYKDIAALKESWPGNIDVSTSADGELALLRVGGGLERSPQTVVMLSTSTLESSTVTVPSNMILGGCSPHAAGFVCHATTESKQLAVVLVDTSGAKVVASVPENANTNERILDLGDAALALSLGKAHRIPYEAGGVRTTFEATTNALIMQDGWLVTDGDYSAPEVKVMSKDGAAERSVAKGARIAPWLGQYNTKLATRLRWVPICDVDATGKKLTNLRFYNPQTNKTVAASASCQVAGMSLSDNYVVYFDNWVPDATGVVSSGDGDLMVMDLRDGSKRPNPFPPGINIGANPIGKSKFVVVSSNPASPSVVSFYNANTAPSTKGIRLPEPITGVSEWDPAPGGAVFATKAVNDFVADAYFVGF